MQQSIVARRGELLSQIVTENPKFQLLAIPADITRPNVARTIIETTLNEYGHIDILINNAGIGLRARISETKIDDTRRMMELNFFALIQFTQAVLPIMRRQGHGQIVNINSILGVIAISEYAVYSASKFAVRAFSDALRLEVKQDGIDVISILPSVTDTPFFTNQIQHGDTERNIKWPRSQSPAHVARVILRACRQRRREVVLTFNCNVAHWAKRLVPGLMDWAIHRLWGRRCRGFSDGALDDCCHR